MMKLGFGVRINLSEHIMNSVALNPPCNIYIGFSLGPKNFD